SLLALVASAQVSYVRAKAESLGQSATVGPAPREARLVIALVGLGLWAATGVVAAFTAAVAIVALLSTFTFIQRVALVAARHRVRRGIRRRPEQGRQGPGRRDLRGAEQHVPVRGRAEDGCEGRPWDDARWHRQVPRRCGEEGAGRDRRHRRDPEGAQGRCRH